MFSVCCKLDTGEAARHHSLWRRVRGPFFLAAANARGWRARWRNHCSLCRAPSRERAAPPGAPSRRSPSGIGRALRGISHTVRDPPSAMLLAGSPYWPPGGVPMPPGCVLCEARPHRIKVKPPRFVPRIRRKFGRSRVCSAPHSKSDISDLLHIITCRKSRKRDLRRAALRRGHALFNKALDPRLRGDERSMRHGVAC